MLQDTIIYFDICAVVILAIIFFSMLFRKMTKGASNISFISLVFVSMVTAVIDLLCNLYALYLLNPAGRYSFIYLLNCLYFIFRNLTTPLYLVYIISISSTWFLFKRSNLRKFVLTAPLLLLAFLIVFNKYTGWIFTLDENCVYHRGPFIFILYLIACFYIIYGSSYLTRHWKILPKKHFVALFCVFLMNLA